MRVSECNSPGDYINLGVCHYLTICSESVNVTKFQPGQATTATRGKLSLELSTLAGGTGDPEPDARKQ